MGGVALVLMLSGCCGGQTPVWRPFDPVYLDGAPTSVDLSSAVEDDRGTPTVTASSTDDVLVEVAGGALILTPQPDWVGTTTVDLVAEDACGHRAVTTLEVHSGRPPGDVPGACTTRITYTASGPVDGVSVAGSFNDWDPARHPLVSGPDGWTIDLELAPGAYPYKLVESPAAADAAWTCDPSAPYIQCDAGYAEAWETTFDHRCAPGARGCNSLLVVASCEAPALEMTHLAVDRQAGTLAAEVALSRGTVAVAWATLDGDPIDAFTGTGFEVDLADLAPGRHTLRFRVEDVAGQSSDEVYVPVWIDDWDWRDGVVYFAFLDRLSSGSVDNDGSEGATAEGGAYLGGDLQGLSSMLDYLDDLGVDILWLSNLQDNAEGAYDGQCGLTYAAYHAYWPDGARTVEEHFGTADDLHALVDAAHDRGMRVIMDWVANHVHDNHPYVTAHPDWFTPFAACDGVVDGQLGFDRIPESCWFAPYLPDIDYAQPEALVTQVDDAMWWAETFELDGFRVDAVKHMSHAVVWNLASAVDARIEHTAAGGTEHFWTIGETFDSYERIRGYLGEEQLSGQFDFPLYYIVRDVFSGGRGALWDVLDSLDTSAEVYGPDARMSTFLGNHDVGRFVTEAAEGVLGVCDGAAIRIAQPPTDRAPYDRLRLAWTFLFTVPGTPLVYYGDELGIPGHGDPDNRQPLAWHVSDLGGVDSVASLASRVGPLQAEVLEHVAALSRARHDHQALRHGDRVEWWREPDLIGYALASGDDHALVVINRGSAPRTLTNGLAFASLPEGQFDDVLTGRTFASVGDQLTVEVGAMDSVVLVWRP